MNSLNYNKILKKTKQEAFEKNEEILKVERNTSKYGKKL